MYTGMVAAMPGTPTREGERERAVAHDGGGGARDRQQCASTYRVGRKQDSSRGEGRTAVTEATVYIVGDKMQKRCGQMADRAGIGAALAEGETLRQQPTCWLAGKTFTSRPG